MSELVKTYPINRTADMVRIAVIPTDGPLQANFEQQAEDLGNATNTSELIAQAQALLGCLDCPIFQLNSVVTLPNSVLPSHVSDISARCLAFGNYGRAQMKRLQEERGQHKDSELFHTHLELQREPQPVGESVEGLPNCLTPNQLKTAVGWISK